MSKLSLPFVNPLTKNPLKSEQSGNKIIYTDKEGIRFVNTDGIPDFTFPKILETRDKKAKEFYDGRAEAYDKFLHLTFKTYSQNERQCREEFIDALELKPNNKVLEIASGTGRDSELIADRLNEKGEFFLQDISPNMLKRCIEKLKDKKVKKHYCISNAMHLPFPDKYFDATYSFGALGEFSNIKQALAEMVRVTKVGGKIVVGDESMPPWLRDTEFCKILYATNPQFAAELPLKEMPVEARDFRLRWVIGGVFYLIDFRVGEAQPPADFDFVIPGERGGTYRTRYEGQLEGVSAETKKLAWETVRKKGVSMHDWLDDLVKKEAKNYLGKKK